MDSLRELEDLVDEVADDLVTVAYRFEYIVDKHVRSEPDLGICIDQSDDLHIAVLLWMDLECHHVDLHASRVRLWNGDIVKDCFWIILSEVALPGGSIYTLWCSFLCEVVYPRQRR